MAEPVAQIRPDISPTKDGYVVDSGYDVMADHVTGSDDGGRRSPMATPRGGGGSSGSASVSSCSSHETVVSVGVRQPEPETRDHPPDDGDRNPTEPEAEAICRNGDPSAESGDEVFHPEMTVMSPLVNRWRRRQQAESEINYSASGPYSTGWNGKSGCAARSDPRFAEPTGESRQGRAAHGYSSDTEALFRTLNRRGTTSGQPVTVSGRLTGQSPSTECPSRQSDWMTNLHRTSPPPYSAVIQPEVRQ